MDSNKLQQSLKHVEMWFILIFGGFHIFAPFIISVLPIREDVLWLVAPMAILVGVLSIAYIVTKEKIQQILKWITMVMFAGGGITHFLYVCGVMPPWFVAMPILAALGGVFIDALAVLIFYDYGRRLS
ncbi:MAG: hypothetical protein ACFFCM_07150 [Promethearchaeota archaeon]